MVLSAAANVESFATKVFWRTQAAGLAKTRQDSVQSLISCGTQRYLLSIFYLILNMIVYLCYYRTSCTTQHLMAHCNLTCHRAVRFAENVDSKGAKTWEWQISGKNSLMKIFARSNLNQKSSTLCDANTKCIFSVIPQFVLFTYLMSCGFI